MKHLGAVRLKIKATVPSKGDVLKSIDALKELKYVSSRCYQ